MSGPISFGRYLKEHGQAFASQPLTPAEQAVADQIHWAGAEPNQCYRNATIDALTTRPTDEIVIHYVEGYFTSHPPMAIPHAWLAINGKVVDTTISAATAQGKLPDYGRIAGQFPDNLQYFGVLLHPDFCHHVLKHGYSISIIEDYECQFSLIRNEPQPTPSDPPPTMLLGKEYIAR